MSHAELDASTDLAHWYERLHGLLDLRVCGCCGTDHEHIDAIAVPTSRSPHAPWRKDS